MPNTTDTRIVQMQFDNRSFEKNIATSEKSLEKFKKALDFQKCGKSLEDFEDATRKLTFDQMASNIQKLTDKFTGLGRVSEYVLSQVRHSLESAAAKAQAFFNSMTLEQVNAGFEKFGQLNKNVQTIMAATGRSEEDVYKVMQRLNNYTDQTSYSFTDMASNIGKFTSVGINLEDAEKQMEGIANWAARSGGSIQEASRAMYNLSQAMGVGALTKIDWKSIENAGMATKEFKEQLIQAGLAEGTLVRKGNKILTSKAFGKQTEVTYQNLADTLSKKWADAAVMQRSFMAYYYDDLYYEGTETLIEVTDAQKKILEDAFADGQAITSKSWKTIEDQGLATKEVKEAAIEAAVAQKNLVKETTKDGKTIYKTAKKYGKQIEVTLDNFEESLKTGWLDKGVAKNVWAFDNLARSAYESAQKCMTFTDVLNAWKDQLSTGWMNSYTHIFGELSESMELFSNICNKVGTALDKLLKYRNRLLEIWGNGGGRNNLWGLIVGEVAEDGEVLAYEGAYGFLDVLMDIGGLIKEGFWNMLKLFAPDDVLSMWDNENARDGWIASQMDQIVIKIRNFITTIHDFFNASADGSQKSRWQQIQDVVNAIFSTFALAYSVIRDVSTELGVLFDQDHFGPVVDALLTLFSELGLTIQDAAKDSVEGKGLLALFKELNETCLPLISAINELIVTFLDLGISFLRTSREDGSLKTFWAALIENINKVAGVVTKYGTPIIKFFTSFIGIVGDLLQNGISTENLTAAGTALKDGLKTMLDSIFSFIPNFSQKAGNLWAVAKTWITNGFQASDWKTLKTKLKSAALTILSILPESWLTGIRSAYTRIRTSFKEFTDRIKSLFESIKNVFKNNFSAASLKELKAKAKDVWANVISQIPEGIKNTAKIVYAKVSSYVSNLWQKIQGLFTNDKALDEVEKKNIFQKIFDWLKTALLNLKTSFQNLIGNDAGDSGSFFESLKKLDWSKILVVLIGTAGAAGLVSVVATIVKVVKTLAKGLEIISDFMEKGFRLDASPKKVETFGDKMLKIAIAIGIIAASLTVIANLKAEDAWRALGIIALIGAVLIGMAALSKIIYKDVPVSEAASAFLGMVGVAVAIGRIVKAILPLSTLNPAQLQTTMNGLTGVILALITVAASAKYGDLSFKGLSGVLALCAGIWLMVNALLKIKDLKPEQLGKMALGLVTTLGALLAFSVLLKKFGGGLAGSGMKEAAFLAASIGILIFALLPLAVLNLKQMAKMGAGLAAVLISLALFMKYVNGLSLEGTQMVQLLAVAGSIVLFVLALLPLTLLKPGQLAQGLVGILVLMGSLVGFMALTRKMTMSGSAMAQLLALAGSIVLLVLALLPLSLMKPEQVKQGIIGVVAIMGALWLFMLGINKLAKNGMQGSAMVQFVILAGAIAAVVVALTPLALMDWGQLGKMGAGLVTILGMFSVIMLAAKKLDGKGALSAMGMMVMVAALIYSFALALTLIPTDMDWKTIGAFSVGLAALILAVGGALKLASSLTNPASAVIAVLAITAAVVAIMGAIALMMPLVLGSVGSSLQRMSAQFSLIGGMLGNFVDSMNQIQESDIDATKRKFEKLYSLITSLKDVSSYYPAIHSFSECCLLLGSGLHQFVFSTSSIGDPNDNNGIKLLEKLLGYNTQLSEFTGGYSASVHMAYLGAGLHDFNTSVASVTGADTVAFQMLDKILSYGDQFKNLNGAFAASIQMGFLGSGLSVFNTATSGITESNPKALELLTNMANNADNLEKLTKIDLTHFSDQMAGLGGALSVYALGVKETSGIEIGDVPDVTGAISILNSLTKGLSDETGGLAIPEIPQTEEELTHFGVQLAALAGGLIEFAKASEGFGENTDKALSVLTFMKNLNTDLTSENLKVTKAFSDAGIYGDSSLITFGTQIASLGSSLKNYADSTKDFEKNQAALDVLDFMADIKSRLNSEDLKVAKVFTDAGIYTDSSLTTFGNQISALGSSMKNYSDSTKDFKKNKNALDAIDFFYNLQKKLKTDQINTEIFSFFSGHNITQDVLTQFGTDIGALGEALAGFANNVNFSTVEGKTADFDNAMDALDTLQKMAVQLPKYGGLVQLWEGETLTISTLADDVRTMGEALSQISDELSAVGTKSGKSYDIDLVKGAMEAVTMFVSMAATLAQNMGTLNLSTGYAYAQTLSEFIAGLVNVPEEVDFSEHGLFIDNIVGFMKRFEDAANSVGGLGDATIFQSFANLATGIQAMAATNPAFDFNQIGLNIDAGIVSGINAGASDVIQAAVDVAISTFIATKKALGIESPSRVFMGLGKFASEGLAIGIRKSSGLAEEAGESMANNTIDSTKGILAGLSATLLDDIDAQPTIRPVLDLSNVANGAQTLNGMFGRSYGIGLDTSGVSSRASRSFSAPVLTDVQNGSDPESMMARMDAMLENIQQMGEGMKNMKLVLDTGAVAGGVVDDIDNDIGRRMFYAGRRN